MAALSNERLVTFALEALEEAVAAARDSPVRRHGHELAVVGELLVVQASDLLLNRGHDFGRLRQTAQHGR